MTKQPFQPPFALDARRSALFESRDPGQGGGSRLQLSQ